LSESSDSWEVNGFVALALENSAKYAKVGLTPATQIKVSGYSGMALAHSRGTSCDSLGTQCLHPEHIPDNFLFFYTPQGGTEKSDSISGVRCYLAV